MNIRLALATGLMMVVFAPRPSTAGDDARKKKTDKEEIRLERKCGNEAEKDLRDAERDRKHLRRDNKWDALCAPPAPPPPPPVVEPPAQEPPPLVPPPLLPPPM